MSARSGERGDDEMAAQFERIIRKVKRSMRYRGSYSTGDILGSLVARWVQSGEWDRLRKLPVAERHIGESVRRFLLDRLEQLGRRGLRQDADDEPLVMPDESTVLEMVEVAELRRWIVERVADLEAGVVDPRVRIPIGRPRDVGHAMRLYMSEKTQREIATELGVSLGAVNKRIAEGTNYLVVLQSIEAGVGGAA